MVGSQGRKCDSVPELVFKSLNASKWGSPCRFLPWRKTKKLLYEFIENLARSRGFEHKVNSCKLLQDLLKLE